MSSTNVYKQLNAAREEFHTLKLAKTGHNSFAKYYYFELGDFLIPALQVFKRHGLCAYISFGTDVATMTVVSVEDGSSIVLTSPMAPAELKGCHPIQNLGAVETYTRRYLWVAALEIVEHDAIDSSKPVEKSAPRIPATPKAEDLGLEPEVIQYLQEFSQELVQIVKEESGEKAASAIAAAGLDNDQKIALWNMLDSKTRSAIKKAKEVTA